MGDLDLVVPTELAQNHLLDVLQKLDFPPQYYTRWCCSTTICRTMELTLVFPSPEVASKIVILDKVCSAVDGSNLYPCIRILILKLISMEKANLVI